VEKPAWEVMSATEGKPREGEIGMGLVELVEEVVTVRGRGERRRSGAEDEEHWADWAWEREEEGVLSSRWWCDMTCGGLGREAEREERERKSGREQGRKGTS
jgi:hypothetical protein